ncbi:MAG: methylated-DNA--[protein]-cysteine S-methyltransferase [Pseudomonadota bacterium]
MKTAILKHPAPEAAFDEIALWGAVAARDARFDGAFVFGPITTRIYCRPSCPSRRPRPENARFFPNPAAAQAAGFRACLRCRPDEADGEEAALLSAACALLSGADSAPLGVESAAKTLGLSAQRLRRLFETRLGVPPRAYAAAVKRNAFETAARQSGNVADALYAAGYGSPRALYEPSAQRPGLSPKAFAKQGKGERMNYDIAPTPLGALLIAGTDKGLACVRLSPDADALEREFKADFKAADLNRDKQRLAPWTQALVEYLSGGPWPDDLPLDVKGTAFQAKVWAALRKIPPGKTVSYADVAAAIGAPKAVRAVGAACGANPTALVTPCHRVLRTDGALGGFRWGLDVKARLLDLERKTR